MKKHFILFACAVLSMSLFAQSKKTEPSTFEFELDFSDYIKMDVPVKCNVYYNEKDEKVYHGPFSANYSEGLNKSGVVGRMEYIASGNYKDGKLDGALKLTANLTITRPESLILKRNLSATYKEGVPIGTWTVNESGSSRSYGGGNETYTITFKDGEVASISTSKGVSLTFEPYKKIKNSRYTEDYFLVSGKWDGVTYVKGVDSKNFMRLTREITAMDDAARAAFNDYASGTITASDLVGRGFILYEKDNLKDEIFTNLEIALGTCKRSMFTYAEGLALPVFDRTNGYSYHYNYSNYIYKFNTYILRRVELTKAKEFLEENNYYQDIDADRYSRKPYHSEEDIREFVRQLPDNYIEISRGDTRYFADEERDQLLAFFTNLLDSRDRAKQLKKDCTDRLEALWNKYKSVPSFKDELDAISNIYNAKERETMEPEVAQKYMDMTVQIEEICQGLDSLHEGDKVLLAETQTALPALNKVYAKMVKNRKENCPSDLSELSNYQSQIKGWLTEQASVRQLLTIYPQMQAQSNQLSASTNAEVVKSYKAAEKSAHLLITEDLAGSISNIEAWMKAQAQYKELDQMYTTIRESETKLNELLADKTLGDVKKVYATYAKVHPAPITEDLQAAKQEAHSVMQVINDCEQFSKTRLKIAEQDQALTEQGKNFKNIAKEYAKYMKAANLAWTAEASADMSQLNAVLAVQSKIAAAYARSDAAELDKAVKKAKVKSLEDILQLIK